MTARTHILDLINAVRAALPILDKQHAREFLDTYSMSDRCALITVAYLGELRTQYGTFLSEDEPVNRYTITGKESKTHKWVIPPEKHAECFFARVSRLEDYYEGFLKCAENSGYDLSHF